MPSERPLLVSGDTLDQTQLKGSLAGDGFATLHATKAPLVKQNQAPDVDGADPPPAYATEEAGSSSDDALETYDSQRPDPDTIRAGSVGGQAELTPSSDDSKPLSPSWSRRGSIPILLEKTEQRGRYMLTADDPEVREIIKRGLERQRLAALGGKPVSSGLRDLVFTRRFTAFDRQNPSNAESPYMGFFVLFWLCMGLLLVRVAVQNYRTYGSALGNTELLRMMFGREVLSLAWTDFVMVGSTVFGYLLQLLVYKGWLNWHPTGIITSYLAAVVGWTFYREWPWTHTVFLVLHGLTFLMKQHSYAFYNGYLYKRRGVLVRKLKQLEDMHGPTADSTEDSSSGIRSRPGSLRQRRNKSLTDVERPHNLSKEPQDVANVAAALSSGKPLNKDQREAFTDIIRDELEAVDLELKGKCSITDNHYPRNLTFANWVEWNFLPTLVYELEYPRQEKINWLYVAEKTAAVFGVLIIMQVISQAYIYPVMKEAVRMKDEGMTLEQRWLEFPFLIIDMMFPLLLEQLLTWYLIWECVLNVAAELTYFADRGFYGNWWSSVSWDQYARDWNRPVHNFLLRHVYHSSISSFHLSRGMATFVTFLLSALVHELIMFCLFKKLRGYLFSMQLAQIPLAMASRTKFMKGKRVLGNILFWTGLFLGPATLASLYLIV